MMLAILWIGDAFMAIGVFAYTTNPASSGASLWTAFVGGLVFSLVGPLIVYRYDLIRGARVIAASESGLEVWHVIGSDTQCNG